MFYLKLLSILIIISYINFSQSAKYDVFIPPKVTFNFLKPNGFEVSIPALKGITRFVFKGNLNKDIQYKENNNPSQWTGDIKKAIDNQFTFVDKTTPLKDGDIIYYWTYMIYKDRPQRQSTASYQIVKDDISCQTITKFSTSDNENINENPICNNTLIFEENFEGNSLNSKNWIREHRFSGKESYEFCAYLDDEETLQIKNGQISFKLIKFQNNQTAWNLNDKCTDKKSSYTCSRVKTLFNPLPSVKSAQISSKFRFMYGRVEIKAKLPENLWSFPQMYLEPWKEDEYGAHDFRSGQMRIAFLRGNRPNLLYNGVVTNKKKCFAQMIRKPYPVGGKKWSDDFHVYSLIWTKVEIKFLVDNELCGSLTPTDFEVPEDKVLAEKYGAKLAPFDQYFRLVFGYGVGGILDFDKDKPWDGTHPELKFKNFTKHATKWPSNSEFKIDYIRIYSFYFAVSCIFVSNYLHGERKYLSGESDKPMGESFLEKEAISPTSVILNILLLICASCGVISSLLVIIGLRKDKRELLVPWIVVMISNLIIDCLHFLYLVIIETLDFDPLTATLFTLDFFILCLNVYCLLCVISQYQEYKAGRGAAKHEQRSTTNVRHIPAPAPTTTCLNTFRQNKLITSPLMGPHTNFSIIPEETQMNGILGAVVVPNTNTQKQRNSRILKKKHVQFPDDENPKHAMDAKMKILPDPNGNGRMLIDPLPEYSENIMSWQDQPQNNHQQQFSKDDK